MTKTEFIEKRRAFLERKKEDLIARAQDAESAEVIEGINAQVEEMQAELDEMASVQEESELNDNIKERNFDPVSTYGVEERESNNMNNVEYRTAWLKDLMKLPLSVEERDAMISADAVIPTEIVDRIYGLLSENRLLNEVNITRFPGYVQIPRALTVNDAKWIEMPASSVDSKDVVDHITLAAKKLIKTITITADMARMSIPAFEDWLVRQLSSKIRKALCAGVLRGEGGYEPTGIIGAVSATVDTVTYDNILKVMAAVDGAYHDGAVWVCSATTFFNTIMTLKDSSQRPLVYQGVQGIEGEPAYMLFGHRVILEESADSKADRVLLFGNFRDGYALNFGSDIEVDRDESVEFRSGSVVYRAMVLADGDVADLNAFAYIQTPIS